MTQIKLKRVIEFYVYMQRKIQLLMILLYGSPCMKKINKRNILKTFELKWIWLDLGFVLKFVRTQHDIYIDTQPAPDVNKNEVVLMLLWRQNMKSTSKQRCFAVVWLDNNLSLFRSIKFGFQNNKHIIRLIVNFDSDLDFRIDAMFWSG